MIGDWFKELRNKRQAQLLSKRIPLVLTKFADLIEKYPSSYIDESWLPLDKAAMKDVLKIAIAAERDYARREWLKTGWVLLSQFQPNIGETPLSLEFPEKFDPQTIMSMDRYFDIARNATDESERDFQELKLFLAELPDSR